jgi:hypothetical protein
MPHPRFIICAESYALDQETNLLSLFQIIDSLHFERLGPGGEPQSEGRSRVAGDLLFCVAVWTMDDSDSAEHDYDVQWEIRVPGTEQAKVIEQPAFRFTRRHQRFVLQLRLAPASESGVLRIASKIRRHGATEWQVQVAEIDLTVNIGDQSSTDEPSSPN